jgi:hypothetical protein
MDSSRSYANLSFVFSGRFLIHQADSTTNAKKVQAKIFRGRSRFGTVYVGRTGTLNANPPLGGYAALMLIFALRSVRTRCRANPRLRVHWSGCWRFRRWPLQWGVAGGGQKRNVEFYRALQSAHFIPKMPR